MKLEQQQIQDLASGAAFLATGGGGDPYLSLLCAQQSIKQFQAAELISINELADDAIVVAVGSVGAPTTSLELLPSIDDPVIAIKEFERHMNLKIDAVVSFEIGGANSLIPIVAAAASGIPVIDGDGMGRALPEVQMMTYSIAGISPTPSIAVDYAGNAVVFDNVTVFEYEEQIRDFAMERGGMITTVEFAMTAGELRACLVPDTVSLAIAIGEVLRVDKGNAAQLIERLKPIFKPTTYGEITTLFVGTVSDVATSVVGGYDIGYASLRSDENDQAEIRVDIKNEYLTVWAGDTLLACVPDLITFVDTETGQPINSERLSFGQRVTVVGIGCPPHFRTAKALEVVGPKCFGFNFDFTPIEELTQKAL